QRVHLGWPVPVDELLGAVEQERSPQGRDEDEARRSVAAQSQQQADTEENHQGKDVVPAHGRDIEEERADLLVEGGTPGGRTPGVGGMVERGKAVHFILRSAAGGLEPVRETPLPRVRERGVGVGGRGGLLGETLTAMTQTRPSKQDCPIDRLAKRRL